MLSQAIKLWSVSVKNLYGKNVFKHTKDKSERARYIALMIAVAFLFFMFEGYIIGQMYAYEKLGMGNIVPIYGYVVGSILVVALTFFKAGSIVFGNKTIDITISLPVSRTSIVLSRLMEMYTTNIIITFLFGVPAIIIYTIFEKATFLFVIIYALSLCFLPLIPMVVTVGISALIKAISSRMKNKSIIESFLMLAFAVGIIVFLSMSGTVVDVTDQDAIKELIVSVGNKIGNVYPPAAWAYSAAVLLDVIALAKLIVLSVVPVCLLVWLISRKFIEVLSALNNTYTQRDFTKVDSKYKSMFMTLLQKELKYYFSCSTYMVNTIMGQIMMVIFSVSLFFIGIEKMEAQLHVNGVLVKFVPFVLAAMACMMPTTSCSISLEGKTHYISRTLPIPIKLLYDSKIAMYLCICAPFYIVSVVISAVATRAVGMNFIWMIIVPAVFICFSAVASLRVNLKLPKLNWDNETVVIKQSASTMLGMLVGNIPIIISAVLYGIVPSSIKDIVLTFVLMLVVAVGLWIYKTNSKIVV